MAKWKGGKMSPGTNTVTGLGFAPDGVIFIGGNGTEGSVVTGDLGVFMGMMGRHYNTGAIDSYSVSVLPEVGPRVRVGYPIVMAATYNTQEYAASAVSLDSDGFTVNWDDTGTGMVYWMAFQCEHAVMLPASYGASGTISLGWIGKSTVHIDYRAGGDVLTGDVFSPLHHAGFGGGWYRPHLATGFRRAGGWIVSITGNAGRRENHFFSNPSGQYIGENASYIGPFLQLEYIYGGPDDTTDTDYIYNNGTQSRVQYLITSHESVVGTMAATDGVGNYNDVAISGNPEIDRADAVIGMTIADSPGNTNAATNMLGFSMACKQSSGVYYNAGVFADGLSSPRRVYMSDQHMVFDVDGTDVLTGTLDFDAPAVGYMRLTTEIDGVSDSPVMVFQAFGRDAPVGWMPSLYRSVTL